MKVGIFYIVVTIFIKVLEILLFFKCLITDSSTVHKRKFLIKLIGTTYIYKHLTKNSSYILFSNLFIYIFLCSMLKIKLLIMLLLCGRYFAGAALT